jgi:hypothetical protein
MVGLKGVGLNGLRPINSLLKTGRLHATQKQGARFCADSQDSAPPARGARRATLHSA